MHHQCHHYIFFMSISLLDSQSYCKSPNRSLLVSGRLLIIDGLCCYNFVNRGLNDFASKPIIYFNICKLLGIPEICC